MPHTAILAMLLLLASPAFADFYSYTDDSGVVHMTDNPENVPEKFRTKVKRVTDEGKQTTATIDSIEITKAKADRWVNGKTEELKDGIKGGAKNTKVIIGAGMFIALASFFLILKFIKGVALRCMVVGILLSCAVLVALSMFFEKAMSKGGKLPMDFSSIKNTILESIVK